MGLIVNGLENVPTEAKNGAITIGNFDGVHRGHRELMMQLQRTAAKVSGPAVVLTFDPPPAKLLRPDSVPPSLTWMQRRAEILFELGVDVICVCKTTLALLELSAESFFQKILVDSLQASAIVEGPNFRFGQGRLGDIELLGRLCADKAISLSIVQGQSDGGDWISSSLIRSLIANGEIEAANRLLVQPYRLTGTVSRGAGRGRTIGFPTANLEAIPVLIPQQGVYAGRCQIAETLYKVAIHIGPNPTFGENASKVEVHVIEFSGDLYGQQLDVELLGRIRGLQKFSGADELIEQLKIDVDTTRRLVAR